MWDEHLTAEELKDILYLDEQASSRLLLHHLAVCPRCADVGGSILDLYREGAISIELDPIEVLLALSRKEAPLLLEQLRAMSADQQKALLREDRRFRSWGLCELLCRESEREALRDPGRAVVLAELAAGLAGSLEEWQPAEAAWLDELRAFALAHLGYARRVLGDLRGAAEAFRNALALWTPANNDVGDVLDYEAHFLTLVTSLENCEERGVLV
jgi:tetratricopeptide (TPR) repeat protein